jgi:molybdopterin converting factor small subunit
MKVKVLYLGYLGGIIGKTAEYIQLPDDTSLGDLLKIILNSHGEKLKREIYDAEGRCLKRGFIILINNSLVLGGAPIPEITLREGDYVIISPFIAGG